MTSYSEKLSIREKIGYSLGDLAANLVFQTLMTYLAYFYTDIYGLDANDATAIISYNPESTYRIVIKDEGLITYPNTWGGGDWDKGLWPFNHLPDNKLYKGSSWVEVRCYPLPDMKYRSNLVF